MIANKKVLLGLMPYWDPLIPPVGIATLKGYVEPHGFDVSTYDLIVEKVFQDLYNSYFTLMEDVVPVDNRGNFYNMGHNVLQDHMMAHINKNNDNDYVELVKLMIACEFSVQVEEARILELNAIIEDIFINLEERMTAILHKETPDVLGLTCYKGTLPASLFVFRLAKKLYPGILNVMGGSVFSTTLTVDSPNYKMILEETKPYIDKIIIGEGEILFLKLLKGELSQSQRVFSVREMGIPGLELNDVRLPDYSQVDVKLYPYMAYTGSVSCPFSCSFCNSKIYWGKYRKKEGTQMVREMLNLYRTYGNQLFYLSDSLLNPVIDDLARRFSESDISLYYDGFHRVDDATCNVENTLRWRRGGLYRVRMGVESGSEHVLHLMGKKISLDQTRASLSALAYAGIKTTTYWVIGHPGETEEDFQKTLDMVRELKNDIYQAEPTPLEYVYSGQSSSDDWKEKRKMAFPPKMSREMLISYNWVLDCEPSREVVLERIYRFDRQCRELGIPNPYSLQEHYEADERWARLHKNAVPSLLKFYNREAYIDENKNVNVVSLVDKTREDDGDFCF